MIESRRKILFPDVTDEQWNDWHWQVRNRIETLEDLRKYISLTDEEAEGVAKCLATFRMAITPYYLSLIQPGDPHMTRSASRPSPPPTSCIPPPPTCWIPFTRTPTPPLPA